MKRGPRRKRDLTYNGKTMHVSELAAATGLPIDVLWQRWQVGDRGETLVRKSAAWRGKRPEERSKQDPPERAPIKLLPDPQFDRLLRYWNRAVFGREP